MHTVTVFKREMCLACEEAIEVVRDVVADVDDVTVDVVDVESDPEVFASYGDRVPVVLVDGEVKFKNEVDGAVLRDMLTA